MNPAVSTFAYPPTLKTIRKLKLGEFKSDLANSWQLCQKRCSPAAQHVQGPHPGHSRISRLSVLGPTYFKFCIYTVSDHPFHVCKRKLFTFSSAMRKELRSQGSGTLGAKVINCSMARRSSMKPRPECYLSEGVLTLSIAFTRRFLCCAFWGSCEMIRFLYK